MVLHVKCEIVHMFCEFKFVYYQLCFEFISDVLVNVNLFYLKGIFTKT